MHDVKQRIINQNIFKMKRLLSFFAIVCLVGVVSVKAQSASDSAYVRDLHYTTISTATLPVSVSDSLVDTTKILLDLRKGVSANGYSFSVGSSCAMVIELRASGSWDSYLYLLDNNYRRIASNDDWHGSSGSGSRIVKILDPGTYHIVATNYSGSVSGSSLNYQIVLDTISVLPLSAVACTNIPLLGSVTDTLGQNCPTSHIYNEFIKVKCYSVQLPQCNFEVTINRGDRNIVLMDDSYNIVRTYGSFRGFVAPITTPGTYHIFTFVQEEFSPDATLSEFFTIRTDTVSAAKFPQLSYRSINIGDTVCDSLDGTDPYYFDEYSNTTLVGKSYEPNNGLKHVKGFRMRTAATTHYLSVKETSTSMQDGYVLLYLLDSNYNILISARGGDIYTKVEPSTTYYICLTSARTQDTGDFCLYTSEVGDLPNIFYVDAVNGDDYNNGLTPSTALATIGRAQSLCSTPMRIYLTDDYHFDANTIYFSSYVEFFPYGKNIRLYPYVNNYDNILVSPSGMIFGNPDDTLFFVIDSAGTVANPLEGELVYGDFYAEINRLKISNSVWNNDFFSVDSISLRNCEITNNVVNDDFLEAEGISIINTTIAGNSVLGSLMRTLSLTFTNSTMTNNAFREPILMEYPIGEVRLNSGTISNNTFSPVEEDYMTIFTPLGLDSTHLGGLFFLYKCPVHIGTGFTTDQYLFLDTGSYVYIEQSLPATANYTIYPILLDLFTESITPYYYEGRKVLAGNSSLVAANYGRFTMIQPDDQTWYLHSDGKLYSSQEGIAQAVQADVALYPNPASDRIFVQFDGTESDEICLFDIYGKQVKRVAASQGANSIGVQDFARGIYFVQVRKNGTVVATRKLVKK